MTGPPPNPTVVSPPPAACSIAFKEWSGVCAALASGRQCLILRKGGVAESGGGFRPEHDAFWLYPTRLHEAQQGLREAPPDPPSTPVGTIGLSALAVVASVAFVDRPERLDALEGSHIWTAETVRARFAYRRPGLWVLGVRVFRRPEPWPVADLPEYAGCKTWVELADPPPTADLEPVLPAEEFGRRSEAIRSVLADAS